MKFQLPRFSIFAILFLLLFFLLVVVFFPSLLEVGELDPQYVLGMVIFLVMMLTLVNTSRTNIRLRLLAEVADSIGRGDYSSRSELKGDDSIGRLAESVNLMANAIETSIADLEESREKLEQSGTKLEEQNEELSRSIDLQVKFGAFLSKIASMEINIIANTAIDSLLDLSRGQIGLFFLYDEQKEDLVCLTRRTLDQAFLKNFSDNGSMEGLPGEVVRQRRWLNLEDVDANALPDINLGFTRARVQSIYGIPVVFQKKLLGVVILAGLSKLDDATRQALANHVEVLANSLINAVTYRAVQKQSIQLEDVNKELLAAHKQKSEFVANMSHELRTPLNSIIGFSGILLKNRKGNLSGTDLNRVEKINRNGRHLLSLINDILDLSKIEAGHTDFLFEDTDLIPIVRDVAEMLQPQADAKSLEVILDLSEPSIRANTDGHKLKQILINLIGNAIKFTKKGSVTVRCEMLDASKQRVRIQVIDSGIGISQEKLDVIFEAFSQADSSTSREFGGTGLGLTISRSIIEMLSGTLTVASEPGRGSTFTIVFEGVSERHPGAKAPPDQKGVAKEAVAEPEKAKETGARLAQEKEDRTSKRIVETVTAVASSSATPGEDRSKAELRRILPITPGKKILVVDDDPDARDFLIQYIQELGAEAKECGDSTRVLALVREFKPDLVTLDIMMPESNGWEVLAALKADPTLSHVPVVIISMVADRNKAISLGAVDALTKPVAQGEFMACARRSLNSDEIAGRRILVVDDLREYQELMKLWLGEDKNDIRTADNGKEAMALMESFRPEVIFLDLMMPIMDGFTFLREIRANAQYEDVPVIVITAKSLSSAERQWIEARAEKIFVKGEDLR